MVTGYGTGAIMVVPAHDERDFEFSKKYGLPIPRVIKLVGSTEADDAPVEAPFTAKDETGELINSGPFNGMKVPEAIEAMTAYAVKHGFGEAKTNFKIRDWGVSRQRAWGTPIPFIHCPKDGIVPVPEEQLPVELPDDLNFNTTGSPLAEHAAFVNTTCPKCGGPARRDTDTMDTFVDSSWYYFRYCDPKNDKLPFAPEIAAYWTPVEQYIGGIEHAVLHLIYTRLWTKIMRDLGLVTFDEPVKRLLTQGMVCLATFRCEEHEYLYPNEVIDGKCIHCGRAVGGRANREDVEVEEEYRGPRRDDQNPRRGHRASVHAVRSPARKRPGMERGRSRRRVAVPGPRLAHHSQMAHADCGLRIADCGF